MGTASGQQRRDRSQKGPINIKREQVHLKSKFSSRGAWVRTKGDASKLGKKPDHKGITGQADSNNILVVGNSF